MKRSLSVSRILLGGFSVGTVVASAAAAEPRVTPESYYTNDYHIPGAGYYHAPFHAFYAQPYNFYDAQKKMYFYGGQWNAAPHRSVVNISAPSDEGARLAESIRSDRQRSGYVPRYGFGSTSGSHTIHS